MRLFLAINLEPEVRRDIIDATAPLRTALPGVSWADESKMHLTLKFLGEQLILDFIRRVCVIGISAGTSPQR